MSEDAIQRVLETERIIDITTTGCQSGDQHRIEIWFHNVDGDIYITGLPGTRSWYANLLENPAFTFHLKESMQVDLPAKATPITNDDERRIVLTEILEREIVPRKRGIDKLDDWVERSPLVAVELIPPSS